MECINHPKHYNMGSIEVIDFIEDKSLNFNRGNIIKYVVRAGYKNKQTELEDLKKAKFYIEREIERIDREEFKQDMLKSKSTIYTVNVDK